jgi:hypothetical protein
MFIENILKQITKIDRTSNNINQGKENQFMIFL